MGGGTLLGGVVHFEVPPAAGEQFLGHLGDQIPTRHVPHSLSAVMLGLDWPKELGKKLDWRAETPNVG